MLRQMSTREFELYRIRHGSEEYLDEYGDLLPFDEQLQRFIDQRTSRRSQLVIPPAPFSRDGLPYLDRYLFVPVNVLDGARGYPSKHHHLHESVVKDSDLEMLPSLIYSSPLVIEQSRENGGYLVALYAADTGGNPCVAIIRGKTDTNTYQLEKITSIYGKDTLPFVVGDALINGLSVYTNELTAAWAQELGLGSIYRSTPPTKSIADYLDTLETAKGPVAESGLYAPSDTTVPLFSYYTQPEPKDTNWVDLRRQHLHEKHPEQNCRDAEARMENAQELADEHLDYEIAKEPDEERG